MEPGEGGRAALWQNYWQDFYLRILGIWKMYEMNSQVWLESFPSQMWRRLPRDFLPDKIEEEREMSLRELCSVCKQNLETTGNLQKVVR